MSVQSFTNESLYDTWYMVGWMLLGTFSHKYKKYTETTFWNKESLPALCLTHFYIKKLELFLW